MKLGGSNNENCHRGCFIQRQKEAFEWPLWIKHCHQAYSWSLPIVTNTADPCHPPKRTLQIPCFVNTTTAQTFPLKSIWNKMRTMRVNWEGKLDSIPLAVPRHLLCAFMSKQSKGKHPLRWSGPWVPQTPKSGHCWSNKHWPFSLNMIPKQAKCLKIFNKPLKATCKTQGSTKSQQKECSGEGSEEFRLFLKNCPRGGIWLAQCKVEHETPDLRVISSSSTLGVELT